MSIPIGQQHLPQAVFQQIREYATQNASSVREDLLADPVFGPALAHYVFFSQHPSVRDVIGFDLDDREKFYHGYYWFRRFVRLYTEKHGFDAGMEQQAFQMLENAEFDLDFERVSTIEKLATA